MCWSKQKFVQTTRRPGFFSPNYGAMTNNSADTDVTPSVAELSCKYPSVQCTSPAHSGFCTGNGLCCFNEELQNEPFCHCFNHYSGTFCETYSGEDDDELAVKLAYDKAMSAVVVVIILIVLLVAAVLVIVCVKRRRRSMSQRREGGRSEEMHYPGSEEAGQLRNEKGNGSSGHEDNSLLFQQSKKESSITSPEH